MRREGQLLTTGVMTGSQQDTTSRLVDTDEMTGGRRAHDAILADQELLDAIGSTNLSNGLSDLRVPVTAITTNDEERALDAFGNRQEDAGNKSLRVVLLLENLDLLAETRTIALWLAACHILRSSLYGAGRAWSCNLRSGLLVLERLQFDSSDAHDGCVSACLKQCNERSKQLRGMLGRGSSGQLLGWGEGQLLLSPHLAG